MLVSRNVSVSSRVLCFTGLILSKGLSAGDRSQATPPYFVVRVRAPPWRVRPLQQTTPVDERRGPLKLCDRDRSPPASDHASTANSSNHSNEPQHRYERSRGCENRASSTCVRCKRNSNLAQLTLSRTGKVSTSCRDNLLPVSISSCVSRDVYCHVLLWAYDSSLYLLDPSTDYTDCF